MGILVETIQNYQMLTEIILELEEPINTGILVPATALALVKYN